MMKKKHLASILHSIPSIRTGNIEIEWFIENIAIKIDIKT
jgi:hypothetical protein